MGLVTPSSTTPREQEIIKNVLTLYAAGLASQLLKCATFGVLLLFGPQQTARNNYPRFHRGPYWTLLDVTHFALFLLTASLGLAKGCLTVESGVRENTVLLTSLLDATCDFALALSSIVLLGIAWKRWRRCLPPSGFVCSLLGFLTTATVLDVVSKCAYQQQNQDIELADDYITQNVLIVTVLLTVCAAGNFVGAGIHDHVISRPSSVHGYQGFVDEDLVSVFSKIACLCLIPTFYDKMKRVSSTLEIPHLRRGMRCKYLVKELTSRLANG
ncbi:uncharacterized protein LOC125760144 [Rhipicephalus sanguineus]|uniref:uncharacterized protein LOC125760144 n=1 Tax=Rhipicephalus sanguineus TaxID=34632 RepID=UPI0020C3ADE6|nr:uncharacterized protein LOC125760144 [Rhipicephalus sanguineus]